MKSFNVDSLNVVIAGDRKELGILAAEQISNLMNSLLEIKDGIRMIFAAAPSQNEFLSELVKYKNIDWSRVTAFHMDEYIGLLPGSNQLFSKYLSDNIFSKVNFKNVHIINSQTGNNDKECTRYEILLKEDTIDIACMGIGENGHLAFNDPPVADFKDQKFVKIVELDLVSRKQQVNDGCFNNIDEVPKSAITITIPALMSGHHLSVSVPGFSKAEAVRNALYGDVSVECPASILRTHPNAILYLDNESASML